MIILDTPVITELMKPNPSIMTLSWLDQHEVTQLYITTISLAEIFADIHVLPEDKRLIAESAFEKVVKEAFSNRVLNFDEKAASLFGKLTAKSLSQGLSVKKTQTKIAAIAVAHDAKVATGNVDDFQCLDVIVVNPFN